MSLLLALPLVLAPAAQGSPTAVDILFLGNSYTGVNDLPGMVAGLAGAAGIATNVAANVPGGCTLGSPQGGLEHVANAASGALLDQGGWDFVVLQEQSVTPSIAFTKAQYMLPAVHTLGAQARAASPAVELVLYQTWGRASGGSYCWGQWCSPTFADFGAMQDALSAAYAEAEASLDALTGGAARTAPVGEAWRQFFEEHPELPLHSGDGSHANAHGTYLAACVMFTTLFDQSPVGNPFVAGLPPADAALLQDLAARAHFEPTCGVTAYTGLDAGGALVFDGTLGMWPLVLAGEPRIGAPLTLDASALPAGAPGAWLAVSAAAASVPFGDHGIALDPSQLVLPLAYLPASGPAFHGQIPADPALTGLDVFAQAAAFVGGENLWKTSSALALELCP